MTPDPKCPACYIAVVSVWSAPLATNSRHASGHCDWSRSFTLSSCSDATTSSRAATPSCSSPCS
ncbi:hypothetical protein EYF80_031467 [Liparis tanakae]|uniref:Uncharacterized protein n=1 Tax=Liparis tanakae TaxID=230148 RepID=A0A4Z2GZ25_9TELE|nr:hypothetical protein EYF80_031467 [Liparis tanakae]